MAALTAFSPRSPRLHVALCACAAPTTAGVRQRTARAARGGTSWRGVQASAAKPAHVVQSLGSSAARFRAAAAPWPPDELATRARAGGAGRISAAACARRQSPFRACCAPPRQQPSSRYGSRLRRRGTVAAAGLCAEDGLKPSTKARAAATGTLERSRRHRLARRSTELVASRAARRTRVTAVAQQLRSETGGAARGGRVPDDQLLGRARPASPRQRVSAAQNSAHARNRARSRRPRMRDRNGTL